MKISFFYSTLLAITAAFLLSSCASLQKGEFAQRKYYDFPKSKHSVVGKETEHVSVNIQDKIMPQDISAHKEKQISEPIASASATRKGISKNRNDGIMEEWNNANPPNIPTFHYSALSGTQDIRVAQKSEVLKLIRKTPHHLPFSDAETTFFVMVIAAILIPPLGVYIKERPRLTSWFWITLVLCILAGGILMGNSIVVAGPGLWLAAAVIALMVVFDII